MVRYTKWDIGAKMKDNRNLLSMDGLLIGIPKPIKVRVLEKEMPPPPLPPKIKKQLLFRKVIRLLSMKKIRKETPKCPK